MLLFGPLMILHGITVNKTTCVLTIDYFMFSGYQTSYVFYGQEETEKSIAELTSFNQELQTHSEGLW